jgi:hypothetical protein
MKTTTNTEMPETLTNEELAEAKGGFLANSILPPLLRFFEEFAKSAGQAANGAKTSEAPKLEPLPDNPNDPRTFIFF